MSRCAQVSDAAAWRAWTASACSSCLAKYLHVSPQLQQAQELSLWSTLVTARHSLACSHQPSTYPASFFIYKITMCVCVCVCCVCVSWLRQKVCAWAMSKKRLGRWEKSDDLQVHDHKVHASPMLENVWYCPFAPPIVIVVGVRRAASTGMVAPVICMA